ncbi:MAG TPA: hypothetical protein DDW94_12315 [Deltaproteobacteria bacterium]|nr:MAG: hypothetical protein A2Z79_08460 [Deltaproteobacteria bacterium GWA2_55_82]OGQ63151.1 MAG: hypothetical protein A3I81_10090 [Deltaproteobacteria bacterium RIFCSPLOWO2_02_FULL_55_12]OIJ73616.1 MAG: hypothetical protein A2V21_304655 [Deltaproteobacteria bacterium GWC2_55_46]HBG47753.1 hypothetical protein [Deltaproteobacteria bacterium]HCY12025.1 hypothetical protein [Deltaproteobacteria bacterium]
MAISSNIISRDNEEKVPAQGMPAAGLLHENAPGVLILTPFYEPNIGGVETHLKDLASFLRKDGRLGVSILAFQPITTRAKGKYLEADGNVSVIRVPWIGMGLFHKLEKYPLLEFLYITPWLFIWTAVFLAFKWRSIDIVHAQGFNAAFVARLLCRLFGKRYMASTHAVYGFKPGSFTARAVRWTLSGAEAVLALSRASKKEMVSIGVKEGIVSTYTYWVDQDTFRPVSRDEAKRSLGLDERPVVLFVGRFIEVKGMELLLEAAKSLGDIDFVFIGDGPLAGEIRSAAEKAGNIIFRGKVANRMLPLHYSAADILCVPSKNEEGFGRVIIEALSCGTPVVASRKGGIPEAIDSSVGVLVEPSAAELVRAIEALCRSPLRLAEMQSRARGYALERFSEANAWSIVERYMGQNP